MKMAHNAGRFSKSIKEIRIHLCQKSNSSNGVREFIENQYAAIKEKNPNVPILIRECSGILPRMYARYGKMLSLHCTDSSGAVTEKGKEVSVVLTNMTSDSVSKSLQELVRRA